MKDFSILLVRVAAVKDFTRILNFRIVLAVVIFVHHDDCRD